jgi:hypothetical protein
MKENPSFRSLGGSSSSVLLTGTETKFVVGQIAGLWWDCCVSSAPTAASPNGRFLHPAHELFLQSLRPLSRDRWFGFWFRRAAEMSMPRYVGARTYSSNIFPRAAREMEIGVAAKSVDIMNNPQRRKLLLSISMDGCKSLPRARCSAFKSKSRGKGQAPSGNEKGGIAISYITEPFRLSAMFSTLPGENLSEFASRLYHGSTWEVVRRCIILISHMFLSERCGCLLRTGCKRIYWTMDDRREVCGRVVLARDVETSSVRTSRDVGTTLT